MNKVYDVVNICRTIESIFTDKANHRQEVRVKIVKMLSRFKH